MIKNGKIKSFFEDRGYGFIIPSDGGKDVFFHTSLVPQELKYLLSAGATLRYEDQTDENGRHIATMIDVRVKYTWIDIPDDIEVDGAFSIVVRNDKNGEVRLFTEQLAAAAWVATF